METTISAPPVIVVLQAMTEQSDGRKLPIPTKSVIVVIASTQQVSCKTNYNVTTFIIVFALLSVEAIY